MTATDPPPSLTARGQDVLDFAEAVMADLGERHFIHAEPFLADLRKRCDTLKKADLGAELSALDDVIIAARKVEAAMRPNGYSVAGLIARDLAEFAPTIAGRIETREPAALAVIDSHVAAIAVAWRKRLLAPSRPVAASLLRNLGALRATMKAPRAVPKAQPVIRPREDHVIVADDRRSWLGRLMRRFKTD